MIPLRRLALGAMLATSAPGARAAAGAWPADRSKRIKRGAGVDGRARDDLRPQVCLAFQNCIDHRDVCGRSGYSEEAVASMAAAVDAIVSATSAAAEAFWPGDRTGTIAAGFDADIVAVADDTPRDVTAARRVVFVMRGGGVWREN